MPGALGSQNTYEEESQMLGQDMNQGNKSDTNTNPFLQTYDTPDREWKQQPIVA